MSADRQNSLSNTMPEWDALRQAMRASNARLPDPSPLVLQRALERINATSAFSMPAPPETAALPEAAPGAARDGGATGVLADGWQRRPLAGLLLLVRRQLPLIGQGIWAASAVVLAMGMLVAFLSPQADGPAPGLLALVAPIVAAVGIALIYGPENDPASELECATPTSPALILLARLVLVYGYDLLLTLAASVGVWLVIGHVMLPALILSWLAPMLFLSALALALSVLWNSQGAIIIALSLWGLHVLGRLADRRVLADFTSYTNALWSNQGLLLLLAAVCLAAAFIRALRPEQRYA